MGKGIYTYYKERLIEIGGNNKCLYLKNVSRKNTYDLGRIFEGRDEKIAEFVDFLWSGKTNAFTIIDKSEKKDILRNLDAKNASPRVDLGLVETAETKKRDKARTEAENRLFDAEIERIKELKREVEEIEHETGRYELFIGYPFVFGCIPQGQKKTLIKAPLLLFPVKIDVTDDTTVEITPYGQEKIHINHALVYAYAQSKKLNIEKLELEYDTLSEKFSSIGDVVEYLLGERVKIDCQPSKNVFAYSKFKEPETKPGLAVRYAAIMGRFPLSNSIYNDYTLLEKKSLTNDAVSELLRTGGEKKRRKKALRAKRKARRDLTPRSYTVKMLDYAQSEVVRRVDECGNMVIYGPPGTGKSQTIVNVITDAICKHKRVLVVSQKKAALDVVFNRLGPLNEKAMYVNDEGKQKRAFYERCLMAHTREMDSQGQGLDELERKYDEIEAKVSEATRKLDTIYSALNTPRAFGISLSEMYSSSYNLPKNSAEYGVYLRMLEHPEIMSMSFGQLDESLFAIRSMNLSEMYYKLLQEKEKNPLIDQMQPDLDIRTLSEVKGILEDISKSKKGLFNISKYTYYRQVLAYYPTLRSDEAVDEIVRLECKLEGSRKNFKRIREGFMETLDAVDAYVREYECLKRVLTSDGYLAVIDNVLRGNTSYLKLVYEALDNYIRARDVTNILLSLDEDKQAILNFAYTECKSYQSYQDILEKLLVIRIYHEVLECEKNYSSELAHLVDYADTTSMIYRLKESQLEVAEKLAAGRNSIDYSKIYNEAENNKDFLYQISKKQKYWPIRKTMEVYGQFVLSLFPCWLLSPENVSCLLPLEKNLFDIVIFDEASQVFIESTIPTIYRGKSIVVAGDDKQLRPSATFVKRYLGADPEGEDDYSKQAALEVDSLLDLAVARYESSNLIYHYRSRKRELIDFSNSAFYSSSLAIAPNISKSPKDRPIERYKVAGKWIDRRNVEEAKRVTEILKNIFKTRKNNESIGIITFNADQQACIADTIDKEASRDPELRSALLHERGRIENGEDVSLFIKNLENVQGDERDVIIFSIGYAENEQGRVYTSFGSLSQEGGENRLNVAITRAKSKIIVVTSIEPEELKVESSKHLGPKLLQKYLMYARAVAAGKTDEVSAILRDLGHTETKPVRGISGMLSVEEQIKERLEKQGYTVELSLGDEKNRISLAVYDKESDRYLLGIELDSDAFAASTSSMERDVYKPRFLEARGWSIMRVWCRDWWLSPTRVIKSITNAIEKNLGAK